MSDPKDNEKFKEDESKPTSLSGLFEVSNDNRRNRDGNRDDSGIFQEDKPSSLSSLFDVDRDREKAATDPLHAEIDPNATLDRDDAIDEEKKLPLHKNPLIKAGAVIAVVTTIVGGAAALYIQSSKTITATKPPEEEKPKQEFANPTVKENDLKGELALSKQQDQLKLGNQPATAITPTTAPSSNATNPATPAKVSQTPIAKSVPVTPSQTPTPVTPTNTYRPTPAPRVISSNPGSSGYQQAYRPPVATRSYPPARPVAIQTAPTNRGSSAAQVRTTQTFRQLPMSNNSAPPVDRVAATWEEQSTRGSFGGKSKNAEPSKVAQAPTAQSQLQASEAPTYLKSEEEIYTLRKDRSQLQRINVGTKVLGITIVPIQVGNGDNQKKIITIGLNQPIVDKWGKIAIPGGSQVQFEVTIADNGWIVANSTKVVTLDGREIETNGVFQLTKDNGEPLVARSMQFGNDVVAQNDKKNFLFGALQNVGKVLTQGDTSSTIIAGVTGTSSSSTTTANPDIIGAILQGGFNPLATENIARSTKEIERLMGSSRIWFLPSGTNIQVIVDRLIQI
jgi:hypothetical protein